MAAANLTDRTLHLMVRLQTGPKEDEQVEEIGGLINSDGEVVTWNGRNVSDQESDGGEASQTEKEVVLVDSQLQDQNQRECSSPTLVIKIVKDDEENVEEEREVVTMARISTLRPARRRRGAPSLTNPDKSEQVPLKVAKRRVGRPRSQTQLLRNVDTEKKEGGDRRPRRKMLRVPTKIPPELLKQPKEKVEYRCSVCGKEFPHVYKLERHELIHTGEKPYCCSICGRGFNQKGNLKTHYRVHLGRKDAIDVEDEVNPSPSELSEYLKSLPGESKIRSSLHCLECGKDCKSQSALQAHHVTTHSEATAGPELAEGCAPRLLLCRRCGIGFDDKEKLEEHMKTHVKAKRYSCPDCGKRFINESYIQVHQRIHTGERPFLCSLCGRGFHTASSLKLHEMQHSGERPYACSICGKTFQINSYLNAHYQTHIQNRPFICSVCGKGYSRAEELKVHHRLHTGERPYKCGECEKSFIYRQGLRQHQRTHGGRRMGPTRQLGRPKQHNKLGI